MPTVAVVGADSAFGRALCACLEARGATALALTAGSGPVESVAEIDLLAFVGDAAEDDSPLDAYERIALGALRSVAALLPLLDRGQMKRLCFVTAADGSLAEPARTDDPGPGMARAALHMGVTILANDLGRDGYTFRLFLPEGDVAASAKAAADHFLDDRADEGRLAIVDARPGATLLMRSVLITGCDRGLGLSLAGRFAREGWRVIAGRYLSDWPELETMADRHPEIMPVPLDIASDESVRVAAERVGALTDTLDLIVNNAAVASPLKDRGIREPQDWDELLRLYNVNALGALRVADAFSPRMSGSALKRLCFVSSEAGSVHRCERRAWYGYCMSKTALNRGVRHLFDRLRPQGYTFRLFHPGWMKTYMSGERNENAELEPDAVADAALAYFVTPRSDEDRLVLRDWRNREWPW